MAPRRFDRDSIALSYFDEGAGCPIVFQHGLGGDNRQVAEIFPDLSGTRRITPECRGQGGSEFGPLDQLSIATFADDIDALATGVGASRSIVGGISMGAAIAMRLALRGTLRPRALVLARPAWLFQASPDNMQAYAEVGALLQREASNRARQLFAESATAHLLAEQAPDNLASLMGFFQTSRAEPFGRLLTSIAVDGPGIAESEARSLQIPTLIIGHDRDIVHPLSYAKQLAAIIPQAKLAIITPKASDRDTYVRDFRSALGAFIGSLQ